MSSPLPSKRRKLNDATSRLSKPFVSPLRTSKSDSTPLRENKSKLNIIHTPYIPSTLAHTIKAPYPTGILDEPPVKSAGKEAPILKFTPARKAPTTPWSVKTKISPEELATKKAITSLELQIKKVQNEVDALKQAKAISSSTTDADLEELTDKWKLATQAVAEELFGSVKERVCRMGGVAAWREMEKRKHDRSHGLGEFAHQQEEPEDDDADCEFDEEGEELPEDEQEYRKKMKRQREKEMREAMDVDEQPEPEPVNEKKAQVWADGGKDDDTFTMDMMLRSLNIELHVIGYDKEAQRWIT